MRATQRTELGLGQGLVETRVRRVLQKCFNTVSREKPFEYVWREWVQKVSNLPQGSLSSQAIEQLTLTGFMTSSDRVCKPLQVERTNGLARRSNLVEQYLSTIYHRQSPHYWTSALC